MKKTCSINQMAHVKQLPRRHSTPSCHDRNDDVLNRILLGNTIELRFNIMSSSSSSTMALVGQYRLYLPCSLSVFFLLAMVLPALLATFEAPIFMHPSFRYSYPSFRVSTCFFKNIFMTTLGFLLALQMIVFFFVCMYSGFLFLLGFWDQC